MSNIRKGQSILDYRLLEIAGCIVSVTQQEQQCTVRDNGKSGLWLRINNGKNSE